MTVPSKSHTLLAPGIVIGRLAGAPATRVVQLLALEPRTGCQVAATTIPMPRAPEQALQALREIEGWLGERRLHLIDANQSGELDGYFAEAAKSAPEGTVLPAEPVIRDPITALLNAVRLRSASASSWLEADGPLLSRAARPDLRCEEFADIWRDVMLEVDTFAARTKTAVAPDRPRRRAGHG